MTAVESTVDPRVVRTRAHVLASAGELLADEGREGFSVDALAKRSGVARTTIYRHWPEIGDLLFDTLREMADTAAAPDTGSVRGDLAALYSALTTGFETSCVGRALPVMLDITRRDPALRPLHRTFIAERRRPAVDAVRRGVARGELPADVDPDLLVDRIAGPVFYRYLVVQDAYAPAEVVRLVDDVLGGPLPRRRSPTRPTAAARRSAHQVGSSSHHR